MISHETHYSSIYAATRNHYGMRGAAPAVGAARPPIVVPSTHSRRMSVHAAADHHRPAWTLIQGPNYERN